jgi:hypothetical protein
MSDAAVINDEAGSHAEVARFSQPPRAARTIVGAGSADLKYELEEVSVGPVLAELVKGKRTGESFGKGIPDFQQISSIRVP